MARRSFRACVALACLLAAGCAPVPVPSAPTPSLAPSQPVNPTPVVSTVPSLGAATEAGRWPVAASALAVDDGSAIWYLRSDGTDSVVGRLDPATGATIERAAGPAPVSLGVGAAGLFLLEGLPDGGGAGAPRTNVIERLDSETLEVVATERLRSTPTSLAVTDSAVLVGGVRDSLEAVDPTSLEPAWSAVAAGAGAVTVVADPVDDVAWALDGVVDDGAYWLQRVTLADGTLADPVRIPGTGTDGFLAHGRSLWVATVDLEGLRSILYPADDQGNVGQAASLPRIAGLAAGGETVWWITAVGEVSRIEGSLRARPTPIGDSGTAIVVASDGSAWAATGTEIVELAP